MNTKKKGHFHIQKRRRCDPTHLYYIQLALFKSILIHPTCYPQSQPSCQVLPSELLPFPAVHFESCLSDPLLVLLWGVIILARCPLHNHHPRKRKVFFVTHKQSSRKSHTWAPSSKCMSHCARWLHPLLSGGGWPAPSSGL